MLPSARIPFGDYPLSGSRRLCLEPSQVWNIDEIWAYLMSIAPCWRHVRSRQAKVGDLAGVAFSVHENILRFQVAMQYAHAMNCLQTSKNLPCVQLQNTLACNDHCPTSTYRKYMSVDRQSCNLDTHCSWTLAMGDIRCCANYESSYLQARQHWWKLIRLWHYSMTSECNLVFDSFWRLLTLILWGVMAALSRSMCCLKSTSRYSRTM